MAGQGLNKELALRIGLAARTLSDTPAARLMAVLIDCVGMPITEEKLSTLKVKDLKQALDGELSDRDQAELKQALACLKETPVIGADPSLPQAEPYAEGDMPGSIRIACASNHAEMLDGHFGSCSRFLIYQVSNQEARLIDLRDTAGSDEQDDKNAYRASLIKDCQVLFTGSIGGPAAAKVVRAGVHPIKRPEACPAREAVAEIQTRLNETAPPWLAKVMGHAPEERVRFEREAAS